MSNINERIKRLDIIPARQITFAEAATQVNNASANLSKYFSILPSRAIQKIPTYIQLNAPGLFHNPFFAPLIQPYALYFQWNVTVGSSWYVEPTFVLDTNNLNNGYLTIKYRIGNTVIRYVIASDSNYVSGNFSYYNNQELPSNVCFEWYNNPTLPTTGFIKNFLVKTSLVINPTTGDDLQRIINSTGPYIRSQLGFNLPAALSINQPTIVFNSN